MTGTNKVFVTNTTNRIITLKGVTKTARKGSNEPRSFKTHLQPGIMNPVPSAFWNIYKRDKIVTAWLDSEILIVRKSEEDKKAKAAVAEHDAAKVAEDATLAQLESESDD